MAYTKLHQSILESTVWSEDSDTRVVWITLLAMADRHGEVTSTIPGLARRANVTLEACQTALAKFLAPDPFSRTADDEGRRLVEIDGGWHLLNYEKYRLEASKDDRKAKSAARAKRYRDRKRNAESVTHHAPNVTSNAPVTHERDIAEAEADTDYESRTDLATESPQESSRTTARHARRERAVRVPRPARVTAGEFVNGGSHKAPTQQPIPSDWRPSKDAQARLRKAVPWITSEIAELRLIEFHAWTAGKIYPPNKRDDVWLGFMVKTDRSKYPTAAAQGWNG